MATRDNINKRKPAPPIVSGVLKTEKELRAEQLRAELAELEDESTQRARECGEKISAILKEYDCKIVIGAINIVVNA